VWAVNIHGYFAGGGMYWRESARLAAGLGWRVVNPSLPGFGGSDPLHWDEVSLHALSGDIAALMDHVGAGPAVLLGHSMGGAVAVQYALDHPDRTLGFVYRDGVGTPAWRARHGIVPAVLSRISPGIGVFADLALSVAVDVPDLFVGRMYSTVRSVLPETRMNLRSLEGSLPVGNMLMAIDQRAEISRLAARGDIPILPIWGVLDRISPASCAEEFAALTSAKVQWVPGGHSWMLARPAGQADVLRHLTSGMAFIVRMEERAAHLGAERASPDSPSPGATVPPLELIG
jgi:pimeloyl-ACP methyl ester carboxylesterase